MLGGLVLGLFLGGGTIITGPATDSQRLPTQYLFSAVWGGHEGSLLLWVLILIMISLAVTQEMGARMGIVSGQGLAALMDRDADDPEVQALIKTQAHDYIEYLRTHPDELNGLVQEVGDEYIDYLVANLESEQLEDRRWAIPRAAPLHLQAAGFWTRIQTDDDAIDADFEVKD